jgi:hypothetical protein
MSCNPTYRGVRYNSLEDIKSAINNEVNIFNHINQLNYYQKKALDIFYNDIYGKQLTENDILRINQQLRVLSNNAGDINWIIRKSNSGKYYIAGYKNMPVTSTSYYSPYGNVFNKINKGVIDGQANIAAMSVLFRLGILTPDTIPHEYAHHYIAWFRSAPIVQTAIKKWKTEEKLVEAIGKEAINITKDISRDGKDLETEAITWFATFLKWIRETLDKLGITSKELLTRELTKAFLSGVDLYEQGKSIAGEQGIERTRELAKLATRKATVPTSEQTSDIKQPNITASIKNPETSINITPIKNDNRDADGNIVMTKDSADSLNLIINELGVGDILDLRLDDQLINPETGDILDIYMQPISLMSNDKKVGHLMRIYEIVYDSGKQDHFTLHGGLVYATNNSKIDSWLDLAKADIRTKQFKDLLQQLIYYRQGKLKDLQPLLSNKLVKKYFALTTKVLAATKAERYGKYDIFEDLVEANEQTIAHMANVLLYKQKIINNMDISADSIDLNVLTNNLVSWLDKVKLDMEVTKEIRDTFATNNYNGQVEITSKSTGGLSQNSKTWKPLKDVLGENVIVYLPEISSANTFVPVAGKNVTSNITQVLDSLPKISDRVTPEKLYVLLDMGRTTKSKDITNPLDGKRLIPSLVNDNMVGDNTKLLNTINYIITNYLTNYKNSNDKIRNGSKGKMTNLTKFMNISYKSSVYDKTKDEYVDTEKGIITIPLHNSKFNNLHIRNNDGVIEYYTMKNGTPIIINNPTELLQFAYRHVDFATLKQNINEPYVDIMGVTYKNYNEYIIESDALTTNNIAISYDSKFITSSSPFNKEGDVYNLTLKVKPVEKNMSTNNTSSISTNNFENTEKSSNLSQTKMDINLNLNLDEDVNDLFGNTTIINENDPC